MTDLKTAELHRRHMGQYMTPPLLADSMVAAIECPAENWLVLDPACGDGNLLLAVARRLASLGLKDIHKRIVGIDLDPAMLATARYRLSQQLGCNPSDLALLNLDFLHAVRPNFLERGSFMPLEFNVVLSNPPYGRQREYHFFNAACEQFNSGTELVFLMPLSFLDRVDGVKATTLDGRPMGVTTGHAIVHHFAGQRFDLKPVRRHSKNSTDFDVLSGAKLYEVGAGTPPQSSSLVTAKPFSSEQPRQGWIPCLRTGDVHAFAYSLNRLWVDYGSQLAHPKTIERFEGPRLFVRRMPIWATRQLGAVYIAEQALCAGDLLVIRHRKDDPELLQGLCVFLNSPEAADFVLSRRPSVKLRMSYPKISGKDLNHLLEAKIPNTASLRRMAKQYNDLNTKTKEAAE